MKKKSLKSKVWDAFSLYIRLVYSSSNGECRCVTCGKWDHYRNQQAGHYIDGRNNTVLFDERLVHPQCKSCNLFKKGNKIKYTKFMIDWYGYSMEQLDEFDNLKFKVKKFNKGELQDLLERYTKMAQNELDRRGL